MSWRLQTALAAVIERSVHGSWHTCQASRSGDVLRSHPLICSGPHSNSSLAWTTARNSVLAASREVRFRGHARISTHAERHPGALMTDGALWGNLRVGYVATTSPVPARSGDRRRLVPQDGAPGLVASLAAEKRRRVAST